MYCLSFVPWSRNRLYTRYLRRADAVYPQLCNSYKIEFSVIEIIVMNCKIAIVCGKYFSWKSLIQKRAVSYVVYYGIIIFI